MRQGAAACHVSRPVAMSTPSLNDYLNRQVVLDTQGPLLYIGRLIAWDERGYWLADADVHDRQDGHATHEEYASVAQQLEQSGARHVNRRRAFVERHAVASISALDDVVSGSAGEEQGPWVP